MAHGHLRFDYTYALTLIPVTLRHHEYNYITQIPHTYVIITYILVHKREFILQHKHFEKHSVSIIISQDILSQEITFTYRYTIHRLNQTATATYVSPH